MHFSESPTEESLHLPPLGVVFDGLFSSRALVFCLHICLCEAFGSHGTGVTDSCELPCGDWELNPGPLKNNSVLLITKPHINVLLVCVCVQHVNV